MSEKGKPAFRRALKYIFFVIIVAAAILALKFFFDSRTVQTYTSPLRQVSVTSAQRMDLVESATFTAYVESEAMVPVIPFVNGTIETYEVQAGDFVEKDQVLATIDRSAYELQLAQAEAALGAYQSSYDRLVQLVGLGAATDQDLDTVQAQMEAAAAQRDLAALQLSYTSVTAPISGTVIMADQASGTIIMADQAVGDIGNTQTPVAVIADTGDLVVSVSVPERYYSTFTANRDNLSVTVHSSTSGASGSAQIISIAPYIDPTTKTFKLRARIDDPSAFTIGMYVQVTVDYATHENAAVLEESVMLADGSVYYVEDGVAHYLDCSDSLHADGHFIVPSGYEDKLFVYDGQNSILDGESVRVKEN